MKVRAGSIGDAQSLMDLRNWFVANSIATFDDSPLSLCAIQGWISQFNSGPYLLLIAEAEGRLLGYCCSQQYRNHPAFSRTVETSIYVQPGMGSTGVGSALYGELFQSLTGAEFHRAVVGIALPNEASIRLHEKFRFRKVGVFTEYAHKWGQAISSQWMERTL